MKQATIALAALAALLAVVARAEEAVTLDGAETACSEGFVQLALPYALSALAAKGISRETLEFHYGKHHAGYVAALNKMPEAANKTIEQLVRSSSGTLFNMAAQVWNHQFYWQSLSPSGGGAPPAGPLLEAIEGSFGSADQLRAQFNEAAVKHFGSGWVWLLQLPNGSLTVRDTHDAGCPVRDGTGSPLLVCDVWEHAYYIDTRNDRKKYLEAFWNAVNWEFATSNIRTTDALVL